MGINTFLVSETGGFSGMGFAIPAQIVRPTVDSLIKYGKVSHGYIGIGISDVTPDEAKYFHVNNASGAVITQVEPNSPGAKAGLKVGDVITELNGKAVSDAGELQVEVGENQPGTTLHLKALRDGNSVDCRSRWKRWEKVTTTAKAPTPAMVSRAGALAWRT